MLAINGTALAALPISGKQLHEQPSQHFKTRRVLEGDSDIVY